MLSTCLTGAGVIAKLCLASPARLPCRRCRTRRGAHSSWPFGHYIRTPHVTAPAPFGKLRKQTLRVCGTRYCPARAAARRGSSGRMPPAPTQSRCAGPLGHYICASITTEAAPTVKLHSSPLFSGTCRRTASDKGTGLEQIQRELNTLQPKLGNSRLREFPHALINAHYTGAFSFSVIAQQPRAHGGAIIC